MQRINRMMLVGDIKANPRNARTHSRQQIRRLARSMEKVGLGSEPLVDENGMLLAGHARVEAAKLNGMAELPVVQLIGLSEAQKRALMLAENKIAESARWDREKLAIELPELTEILAPLNLDIAVTGFEIGEVEQILTDFEDEATDPADESALRDGPVVSKTGDLWELASHRVLCGDARSEADLSRLMAKDLAAMAFLDPPYNVRVADIVGRGEVRHPEFAMASGEMAKGEFIAFLGECLLRAERVSRPGAVHFVCMDWRHIFELVTAGEAVYGAMLNLVVWAKTNGGQGSFYRSQHELISVFRVGEDPHLNAVQLGRHGRNRSNVWTYAGVNTFRAGRLEEMRSHPTVKPVAMVADAIKDCTRRGEIVLDTFSGSGSTLMAAERVGRRARCLEIAPNYVDVAIRRWQAFTGKDAIHDMTGQSFDEMTAERTGKAEAGNPAAPSARRKTGRRHEAETSRPT